MVLCGVCSVLNSTSRARVPRRQGRLCGRCRLGLGNAKPEASCGGSENRDEHAEGPSLHPPWFLLLLLAAAAAVLYAIHMHINRF